MQAEDSSPGRGTRQGGAASERRKERGVGVLRNENGLGVRRQRLGPDGLGNGPVAAAQLAKQGVGMGLCAVVLRHLPVHDRSVLGPPAVANCLLSPNGPGAAASFFLFFAASYVETGCSGEI